MFDKSLLEASLFEFIIYGIDSYVLPNRYWKDLFKNKEMKKLVDGEPYNSSTLFEIILKSKSEKYLKEFAFEKYKYLAFITSKFFELTNIKCEKLPSYIDPDDIFDNFNYYHTHDDLDVIVELIFQHNEKYKIRKIRKEELLDPTKSLDSIKKIIPLRIFDSFKSKYDETLSAPIFHDDSNILVASIPDKKEIYDNYFSIRYLQGNNAFIFSPQGDEIDVQKIKSSINVLNVYEDKIVLERSGKKNLTFLLSN